MDTHKIGTTTHYTIKLNRPHLLSYKTERFTMPSYPCHSGDSFIPTWKQHKEGLEPWGFRIVDSRKAQFDPYGLLTLLHFIVQPTHGENRRLMLRAWANISGDDKLRKAMLEHANAQTDLSDLRQGWERLLGYLHTKEDLLYDVICSSFQYVLDLDVVKFCSMHGFSMVPNVTSTSGELRLDPYTVNRWYEQPNQRR